MTDKTVKAQAKALATLNPTAAKKLLTDNGFTYKGNNLIDPKGNPVSFQIHVISGWSDWVASLQIITKNLQAVGIDATVKLEPDWNSWYPNASSTKTPTLLWQGASQGSPYGYFYSNMHQNAYIPSGQDGTPTGNWEHYQNPTATSILNKWKVTLDPKKQQSLRDAAREPLAQAAADHPAVHRAALVDLQHQVLPLLHVAEELLRRSDLHHVPRQRVVVHAHLPRR